MSPWRWLLTRTTSTTSGARPRSPTTGRPVASTSPVTPRPGTRGWSTKQGEAKRYIVEGNHRVAAMRERGAGDVQAHVMRGKPGQTVGGIVQDFNTDYYEHVRRKKEERQRRSMENTELL